MKLADRGLNYQAQALEEAQTEIRLAVRDGWMNGKSKLEIDERIQSIVRNALKRISTADLREAAYRSLNVFAERQYKTYLTVFGSDPRLFLAVCALNNATTQDKERIIKKISGTLSYETDAKGVPLQEYSQDYINNRVKPTFKRLLEMNPLDPDDVSGRNSLRNRAEMEVRYDAHLRQIDELKTSGTKLVVASVHADCSDRCYKWQGRVYSLDGTSGTTEDGKPYVPLEEATDIYYTTKAGKTYKNGLLGFNCRHTLTPYKPGMVIPHVSKETQEKEQAINTRQRELERNVRRERDKALMFKGIDREKYLAAKKSAIEADRRYREFSHNNGRAYYPSRTKIL